MKIIQSSNRSCRSSYILALILISIWILVVTPDTVEVLLDPDYGNQLSKSDQILRGFHPFINYQNGVYGPAVFYLSAVAQLITQNRLIGEILLCITGWIISYLVSFKILNKIANSKLLAFSLLVIMLILMPRFYKYYILLGPILFTTCLWNYISSKDSKLHTLILLALSSTVAGFFRIDIGVYTVLSSLLAITLREGRNLSNKKLYLILKYWFLFLGFSLLYSLPYLAFLFFNGDFSLIIQGFINLTIGTASGLALPAPTISLEIPLWSLSNRFALSYWGFKGLPLFTGLWAAWLYSKPNATHMQAFIMVLSFFSGLLFFQATHRSDISHLLQAIPISFLLISWIIRNIQGSILRQQRNIRAVISILLLSFFLIPLAPLSGYQPKLEINRLVEVGSKLKEMTLGRERLIDAAAKRISPDAHWSAEVIQQTRKNTQSNTSVLFLPYFPQFYYFAERPFTTEFGWLSPGVFKQNFTEIDFIDSLKSTDFIVDVPSFSYDGQEARNSRYYAPTLMKYIYQNYSIIGKIGPALLLKKNADFTKQDTFIGFYVAATPSDNISLDESSKNYKGSINSLNTIDIELITSKETSFQTSAKSLLVSGHISMDPLARFAIFFESRAEKSSYIAELPSNLKHLEPSTTLAPDSFLQDSVAFEVLISLLEVQPGSYYASLLSRMESEDQWHQVATNSPISVNIKASP